MLLKNTLKRKTDDIKVIYAKKIGFCVNVVPKASIQRFKNHYDLTVEIFSLQDPEKS